MNKETIAMLKGMSLEELAKAVKEIHGLSGTEHIHELWQDLHGIPKAGEEVVSGPAMISSGSGAEKAVKDYTNPAPQVGVTKEYTEFATVLADFNENFGSTTKFLLEGMTSFADMVSASTTKIVTAKAEGKADKPDTALTKAWNDLAALESEIASLDVAISKADTFGEEKDVEGLDAAKESVVDAEKHLDEVKDHEEEELLGMKSINSAYMAMQRGWNAVAMIKATALARFGLTGEGNQADEAVPGRPREKVNETVEGMDGSTGVAGAKSQFRVTKKSGEEMKGMYSAKVEDPEEHEKLGQAMSHFHHASTGRAHPADEAAHKAVRDALHKYESAMTPEHKAEVEHHGHLTREHDKKYSEEHKASGPAATGAGMEKLASENAEIKRLTEELSTMKATMSNFTHMPTAVPIIMKSGQVATNLIDKINSTLIKEFEEGRITEETAQSVQHIINYCKQSAAGHLPEAMVKAEIARSSPEAQSFLELFSQAN